MAYLGHEVDFSFYAPIAYQHYQAKAPLYANWDKVDDQLNGQVSPATIWRFSLY